MPLPSFAGIDTFDTAPATVRRAALVALAAGMVGLAWMARADLSPNPMFHPHGYCYLWEPRLVGVHVASDSVIALSYLAIATTLLYLVQRSKAMLPFGWMVLTFGAFIVACGATHAMEIVTLWQPLFWTSADIKVVTAVASIGAAVALPPLVPRILAMLESARVSEARRAQLEVLTAELEERVAARTADLHAALTREQAARRLAEVADRAKDDFLGMVSHELRTPLNAILGWSSMLSDMPATSPHLPKAASAIQRNARVQAQLVEDLIDFTRSGAGKLQISSEAVIVERVVSSAVETIAPAAQAKQQRLHVEDAAPAAVVLGEPRRLQQLIWNLLSNAVKFTPEGGDITVSVTRVANRVRLRIGDTGRGIDPQVLPRIFDRFVQADTSTTREVSGLGLGLSLAREIVELHGGTIQAESEGIGKGSTFIIELPLLGASEAPLQPFVVNAGNTPDLAGRCILVIDDDIDTLDLLTVGLAAYGVIVVPAPSAAAARDHMNTVHHVDAVVTDISMPGEDGITFVNEFRRRNVIIPVLGYSALARLQPDVLPPGFDAWLSKPAALSS